MELPKNPTRRQKQPISVPFVWETKPGTPKNDWKIRPSRPPPPPPCHQPVKLIASVPFEWEEKPGKPKEIVLESFSFPNEESFENEEVAILESDFEKFSFKTDEPIKLIASIPFEWEEKPGKPLPFFHSRYENENETENENDSGADDNEVISESDSETLSFHTNESESFVPSLLANCLVPAGAIANAVPVLESPPSPPGYESDSSTSSYATGTTSLVGAPFLEKLFPLLSPKLNFLENSKRPEENENSSRDRKMELPRKDSVCDSSFGCAIRKPTTLGELIMMSRRRSYVRKAVQIRTHNSMGSMKKGAMGCFMFDINNKIEGVQKKMKRQLQLKLI